MSQVNIVFTITNFVLQDGVGNQIEKVYQKFEVEPETEEATVEE